MSNQSLKQIQICLKLIQTDLNLMKKCKLLIFCDTFTSEKFESILNSELGWIPLDDPLFTGKY